MAERTALTTTVVGIDTSLVRSGVAAVHHGDPATLGVITDVGYGGTDTDGYPQRRLRIRSQMHALARIIATIAEHHHIAMVVIEGPMYGVKTLPSYFDRAILWGALCDWIDTRNIPVAVIPPATREKFITGVGSKGDKPRVLKEMRALWCPEQPALIANHDQADALGLATMGAVHLGWRMPFRLRRCHIENVHAITWPDPVGVS